MEKAKALASNVADRERRRIEIREKQLAAMEALEDVARHVAYKKLIDEASRRCWRNADPDLPESREIMKATASVR